MVQVESPANRKACACLMSGRSPRRTPSCTLHALARLSACQPLRLSLEKSSANRAFSGRVNPGEGGGGASRAESEAPSDKHTASASTIDGRIRVDLANP